MLLSFFGRFYNKSEHRNPKERKRDQFKDKNWFNLPKK